MALKSLFEVYFAPGGDSYLATFPMFVYSYRTNASYDFGRRRYKKGENFALLFSVLVEFDILFNDSFSKFNIGIEY